MFLVIIHEYGHFRTARFFWVKVEEFGIGIPPKAFDYAKDKQWTTYSLNWIPLWWFVRLKGEDPSDEAVFLAKDSFITASLFGKLIILFWGITVNILFAWFAFSIAFRQWIKPLHISDDTSVKTQSYLMTSKTFLEEQWIIDPNLAPKKLSTRVAWVMEGSRAANAGIQTGDTIISVWWSVLQYKSLSTVLQQQLGKSIAIVFERNGVQQTSTIQCASDECLLWILLPSEQLSLPIIQFPFWKAVVAWWDEMIAESKMTFTALGTLGKNLLSFNKKRIQWSVKTLSGPVGIVKMIDVVYAQWGRRQLLAFAGMISLALAIFNLLPIPALDGWRALSVIIQAIGGRKATTYFVIENYLNMFFFVLLMLLWVWIILKDLVVFRWFSIPFIW